MEASDRGAATHVILRPADGRSIHLGNFAMTVKATAEETDGAFTLFEADEPPGFGPPMHIHHEGAEAFYVGAGDEEFVCRAGPSFAMRKLTFLAATAAGLYLAARWWRSTDESALTS